MSSAPDKTARSCCSPDCCPDASAAEAVDVREQVRAGYGAIAREGSWAAARQEKTSGGCGCAPGVGGGCCGASTLTPDQVAAAVGYAAGDLAGVPREANMGLSCGNPTAIASLKAGETVLDLGAGGGFDCFIAGPKVGPAGRVIGVDMTPEMVIKARRGIDGYRVHSGLNNVEFRLGEIESLPVADASVDVVISNCVLNLSPDKARVWSEVARVLRPGGRVAVSDLALLRPLPESVRSDAEALIGCIAGAALVGETRRMMEAAGFTDIVLTPKPSYVEALTDGQDPLYRRIVGRLPAGTGPADYITSLDIRARKPA